MITDDFRKLNLLDWLQNDLLLNVTSCEPASSDASFRRYFRVVVPGQHFIAMDAPPDKENTAQFIKVAELLRFSGLTVPIVYRQNLEQGFLLLEDFGDQPYLAKLSPLTVDRLYGFALESLLILQTHARTSENGLPHYDEAMLRRELNIFAEWLIDAALAAELPEDLWHSTCKILIDSALEQPLTCVHRDFHSRNLMVLGDNLPGILDFQDAVNGPISYDLVSLLRDCYIAWPEKKVQTWLQQHYDALVQANVIQCEFPVFKRWFDLMGIQRHLKAIGIFSRLNLRDNKPNYLKDIPRTLAYVLTQTAAYPELMPFHQFLTETVQPEYPNSREGLP